jgi:hypothetical protein
MVLLNVIISAVERLGGTLVLRLVVDRSKQNNPGVFRLRITSQGFTYLETVQGRQRDIEKNDIRFEPEHKVNSLLPVMAGDDVKRFRHKYFFYSRTELDTFVGDKDGQTSSPCPSVCSESENGRTFAASEFYTVTANFLLVESESGFTERTADKHEKHHSFELF